MEGWQKLSHDELERNHSVASDVVANCRTEENQEMTLAEYNECTNGTECLTCPIMNISVLRVDSLVDDMRKRLPSANFTLEGQAGGRKELFVDLYKYRPREAGHPQYEHEYGHHGGGGGGGARKPSTEWGMFLLSVEMLLSAAIWYRANTGLMGF